jgi:hypothetical protein
MKKIIAVCLTVLTLASCDVLKQLNIPLTEMDVANGIKEALIQGVNRGGSGLFSAQANGNSGLLNELLPADIGNLIGMARNLGLSPKIDKFSNTLNDAAINSAKKAVPIFISSIKGMNLANAWNILRGASNAGTNYLRQTTNQQLISAIRPEVNSVFNLMGLKPNLIGNLNTSNPLLKGLDLDLTGLLSNLITQKMFAKIEQEEARVRTDVGARSTALMQKVFASANFQPQPGGLR